MLPLASLDGCIVLVESSALKHARYYDYFIDARREFERRCENPYCHVALARVEMLRPAFSAPRPDPDDSLLYAASSSKSDASPAPPND